jgi:hypothetical protein
MSSTSPDAAWWPLKFDDPKAPFPETMIFSLAQNRVWVRSCPDGTYSVYWYDPHKPIALPHYHDAGLETLVEVRAFLMSLANPQE